MSSRKKKKKKGFTLSDLFCTVILGLLCCYVLYALICDNWVVDHWEELPKTTGTVVSVGRDYSTLADGYYIHMEDGTLYHIGIRTARMMINRGVFLPDELNSADSPVTVTSFWELSLCPRGPVDIRGEDGQVYLDGEAMYDYYSRHRTIDNIAMGIVAALALLLALPFIWFDRSETLRKRKNKRRKAQKREERRAKLAAQNNQKQ